MFDVRKFWNDILKQDRDAIRRWFCPEAEILWHCSGEQFNVEEFIAANCEYPGQWDGTVERIERLGDTIITATEVFTADKSLKFYAISFFELKNGKIIRIDEYWADQGEPPEWRQKMDIGKRI